MGDILLQSIYLGAILQDSKLLEKVDINDFSDDGMADAITMLKQGKVHSLAKFLNTRNVTWHSGNGRAIDAVIAKVKKQSDKDRAHQVCQRARYLISSTPEQLVDELKQLIHLVQPEVAESDET